MSVFSPGAAALVARFDAADQALIDLDPPGVCSEQDERQGILRVAEVEGLTGGGVQRQNGRGARNGRA